MCSEEPLCRAQKALFRGYISPCPMAVGFPVIHMIGRETEGQENLVPGIPVKNVPPLLDRLKEPESLTCRMFFLHGLS